MPKEAATKVNRLRMHNDNTHHTKNIGAHEKVCTVKKTTKQKTNPKTLYQKRTLKRNVNSIYLLTHIGRSALLVFKNVGYLIFQL